MTKIVITLEEDYIATEWVQLSFSFPEYWWSITQLLLGNAIQDSVSYDPTTGILNAKLYAYSLSRGYTNDWAPIFKPYEASVYLNIFWRQYLCPFVYKKPILKKWRKNWLNANNIEFDLSGDLRSGYIPIHLTEIPVARPSNHIHELKIWLFCIVKIWENRETRFFPEWSIDESVFEQARVILWK